MTTTGVNRARYAREMEAHPSRFGNDGQDYREWAARADRWALSTRYQTAKTVVDTRTAGTLEGQLLDTFTASAIVAAYEGLTDRNRERFDRIPLETLIGIVWKVVGS